MTFNRQRAARYLAEFDLKNLFVEELGWDLPPAGMRPLVETFDGYAITLTPVVQKKEFYLFRATTAAGDIPPAGVCSKVETWLDKRNREHLLVFTDAAQTQQAWLWVRREAGQPLRRRTHSYHKGQPGESLLQKLEALAISFDEEEDLSLVEVVGRARAAFNVERATKRFYDRFKQERNAFERFVAGIGVEADRDWYVSVMLNRLMFVYFIQRKGFLDGDPDYLRNRLRRMQNAHGQDRFYSFYRYFLLRLFHDGLGQPTRTPELEQLLGRIPYLNGGIFQVHEIEARYPEIQIPDEAFERILGFFDGYQWHLDDRPLRQDNEINPDVLGYIFEKYINQKEMGAYYTKEDITGYISQNTVIPRLFDMAQARCAAAFAPDGPIWTQLSNDPDRYIYAAVRHGVEHDLPTNIAAGLDDVSARGDWNTPAPPSHGLPTEIWRETVARRQRREEVWLKLAGGEVTQINDLITLNLDIRQFAQDVLERCEGADLLKAFWEALSTITILDPTCGSGAFLFAALNILQPLYEACLARMEMFLDELGFVRLHPNYSKAFQGVLAQVDKHPNRTYFVLKTVVVNNLYGVDIMPEAVEICKLRLFLKLAAQVEPAPRQANYGVEPLPDIDFNIQAGNTLVGFATHEEAQKAVRRKLDFDNVWGQIEERTQAVNRLARRFRQQQTELGGEVTEADKQELRGRLATLEETLNRYLAQEYGIEPHQTAQYDHWLALHQPFHWFTEFYGIIFQHGGFDVIIGNPPYVEYSKVRSEYKLGNYETIDCGNLYAYVIERSIRMLGTGSRMGMIVQLPIVCTDRMKPLQKLCFEHNSNLWFSNFDDRPARLFEGLEHIRATILLTSKGDLNDPAVYSTNYQRWHSGVRDKLFWLLQYWSIRGILQDGTVPKIGNAAGNSIMRKILGRRSLGHHLSRQTAYPALYHNAPQYWVRAMNYEPYFWNERDGQKLSTQMKSVFCSNLLDAEVVVAALNSSLFYWWFITLSDCRHLNLREIERYPLDLGEISLATKQILHSLVADLMEDYQRNATRKAAYYRSTGAVEYDEFYPRLSKRIIDRIDLTLAAHYGLSKEEIDYILNYDIKYRMGSGLSDSDSGEGG